MKFLALLLLGLAVVVSTTLADVTTPPPPAPYSQNLTDADVGNWTVGDCIMAQFGMEFTIRPNKDNLNDTLVVKVDPFAKVEKDQSQCGNETQLMVFHWKVKESNSSEMLLRNMTLVFMRENTTLYGVQRLYGYFEIAKFNRSTGDNSSSPATTYVSVDSGDVPKLMFPVPFKRSFLCSDLGDWSLITDLFHDYDDPQLHERLTNTTISSRNVQFDAFRTDSSPPDMFRSPVDCDYMPNDIVPIIVGAVLAVVVLIVIAAYIYGRRRHRQSSYDQV